MGTSRLYFVQRVSHGRFSCRWRVSGTSNGRVEDAECNTRGGLVDRHRQFSHSSQFRRRLHADVGPSGSSRRVHFQRRVTPPPPAVTRTSTRHVATGRPAGGYGTESTHTRVQGGGRRDPPDAAAARTSAVTSTQSTGPIECGLVHTQQGQPTVVAAAGTLSPPDGTSDPAPGANMGAAKRPGFSPLVIDRAGRSSWPMTTSRGAPDGAVHSGPPRTFTGLSVLVVDLTLGCRRNILQAKVKRRASGLYLTRRADWRELHRPILASATYVSLT